MSYYNRGTIMPSNPYEMRWETYTRAEDLLTNRFNSLQLKYNDLVEKGKEPGEYPEFPTDDDIFNLAQRMRNYVADKGE